MSRQARKSLLACVLVLALAGCGGDDAESEGTLTAGQAKMLEDNLTQVENYFSAGRCEEAAAEADQLVASVDALPAEVGKKVKEPLFEMARRLEELTGEQCEESDAEKPTDPATTVPPPADPNTSTTSETDTTTDASEDEPEEEEEKPEDEDHSTTPEPEPPGPDTAPGQQPGGPPGGSGDSSGTGGFGEDGKR